MDGDRGRGGGRGGGGGRGRGWGRQRGSPGRSGGQKFMGSGFQPPRRYDPTSGGYSRGRREKFVYVPKHQEGQNSSEAISGVSEEVNPVKTYSRRIGEKFMFEPQEGLNSEEVKSVIACDLAHNGNGLPLSSRHGSLLHMGEEETQIGETSREVKCDDATLTREFQNKVDISCEQVGNCPPLKHGDEDGALSIKSPKTPASDRTESSESSSAFAPFDICRPKTSTVKLKSSLLATNRERRKENKRATEGLNGKMLRSGMVLLKGYLSTSEQIDIVKQCHILGLGDGGFYEPGYRDGAKLHLKMMCLGKNWDPQTSEYGDRRPIDDAKPPNIPFEFLKWVEKAIQDSHSLIRKESKVDNAEKILPWMKPDICLVNFYSTNGRLGLHQDRDESPESLSKKLPVVSFSIGDAAEFKYGNQRDVEEAERVLLESGDVLIFGGESRNVFHGVTAIHPNTAPKILLEETNLRPGRVNLTFRQY